MRFWFGRISSAICGLLLCAGYAWASASVPTAEQITSYLEITTSVDVSAQHSPLLVKWDGELRKALKAKGLDRAAVALGAAYELSTDQMHDLISIWVLHQIADENGSFYSDIERKQRPELWPSLRTTALALVAASGHKPLVVSAAAVVLSSHERCDSSDFTQLIDKTPDPVATGWMAVDISDCASWHRAFMRAAPGHNTASLLHFAYWGDLETIDELAVFSWLGSAEGLAHFDAKERSLAQTYFAYAAIDRAWKLGLAREGVALFEQLPADIRANLLEKPMAKIVLHPDGLEITIEPRKSGDEFKLDLAAAYLQLKRTKDAETVFASVASVADAKRALQCLFDAKPNRKCPEVEGVAKAVMLDRLLHQPDADPYDLAETYHGAADKNVWVGVVCGLFAAPYDFCESAKQGAVEELRGGRGYDQNGQADALAAIRESGNAEIARLQTVYRAAVEQVVAAFGGKGFEPRAARQSIDPLPSRFAQLPLPEAMQGKPAAAPQDWIKALAPLPQGYEPVRIERSGTRVVAITLSQNYDPTGEVSPGGYWVHLSDDGGKTWKRPLYTGLSYGFPYVVLENSKLPLIDGDTLNIAADIQLIDTASIMYPPVALQSRKQQTNLYLKVPLADLMADSDGDGLTDIAETHLLLDPHRSDTDSDGLIDSEDPIPNVKRAPGMTVEQQAMQLVLEKIFSMKTGAIIQTVDHSPDKDPLMAAITSAVKNDPNSADRPIFVEGDAADFAAFQPNRMMLVYSAADIEKLRHMTPDFHAMSLGKIVFNRTHTRGYFTWSMGWTGGTVRLIREKDSWKLEEISSWIT